jgi:hypothetical protein
MARVAEALGNLAYTLGACERALPDLPADAVVLSLTGAEIAAPTAEQRTFRRLYTGLFLQGRANPDAARLTAGGCRQMVADMTGALHATADDKTDL